MIICCNCGELMCYDSKSGGHVHVQTKLPQCSLRDAEARVNAQRKVNDLRKRVERLKR